MFNGCTSLSSVEVSFAAWDPASATTNWLQNVAASGTFTCPMVLDTITRDASHVPVGWNVVRTDAESTKVVMNSGTVHELDVAGELLSADFDGIDRSSVSAVYVGDVVTSIGESAFKNNAAKIVDVGSNVSSIGADAFNYRTSLQQLIVHPSLKSIANNAFLNLKVAGNLSVGGVCVEDLDAWSQIDFASYTAQPLYYGQILKLDGNVLTSLEIGSGADPIAVKAHAFRTAISVETADINNVSSIGDNAFRGLRNLRDVTVSPTVSAIGTGAFSVCSSLSCLAFEGRTLGQVQAMANYPWGVDPSIISAESAEIVTTYVEFDSCVSAFDCVGALDEQFFVDAGARDPDSPADWVNGEAALGLSVGQGVTSIGDFTFAVDPIMRAVLPNTLSSIGEGCFLASNAVFTLPASVTEIGMDAFQNATGLAFEGKTLAQVESMANYPWGMLDTSRISAELG